ncbi:MAG: short-chain dehydrogenase [Candidatus Kapaibacterium sp.]|nr:short-chain dehydrogenase [Bacteroidota bacterium]
MTIKNSTILVLGGWGLVGSAIIHKLVKHQPKAIIVSSLSESEAKDAVAQFSKEYEGRGITFIPWWGNIFTRTAWKDTPREKILSDPKQRLEFIADIVDDLTESVLSGQALYSLITEHKPDAVIDCINTATAIAYQDIYTTSRSILADLESGTLGRETVERLLASLYIPQLVRHIQIMHKSLRDAGTQMYIKIGTSGTGGMGLNIPYTHSEEKPSRVLLSKSAIAGAQSLLLFLMARTPEGPIVKEIKPSAAIAWKKVAYGGIRRKGKPLEHVDMKTENALSCIGDLTFADYSNVEHISDMIQSVYIDTGENGIFSRAEFETVSSVGQMEIVTPEEIAHVAVNELRGSNTGFDVMQGLDSSVMGPTYRGGALKDNALEMLRVLEQQNNTESIGFEMLGPPRLTKLLYEANILKHVCGSYQNVLSTTPDELAKKAEEFLQVNQTVRSTILSVGLPILLKDGATYLRGKEILIPLQRGKASLTINDNNIEKWCYDGWVDLRIQNFTAWQNRIKKILEQASSIDANETGSRYEFNSHYWGGFTSIDEGKVAAWILHHEERGGRVKR